MPRLAPVTIAIFVVSGMSVLPRRQPRGRSTGREPTSVLRDDERPRTQADRERAKQPARGAGPRWRTGPPPAWQGGARRRHVRTALMARSTAVDHPRPVVAETFR